MVERDPLGDLVTCAIDELFVMLVIPLIGDLEARFNGHQLAHIALGRRRIQDELGDVLFSVVEGWPGIRNPRVKDFIVKYQIPADAWYVANPHMTVPQAKRLEKLDKALNQFLDKIS